MGRETPDSKRRLNVGKYSLTRALNSHYNWFVVIDGRFVFCTREWLHAVWSEIDSELVGCPRNRQIDFDCADRIRIGHCDCHQFCSGQLRRLCHDRRPRRQCSRRRPDRQDNRANRWSGAGALFWAGMPAKRAGCPHDAAGKKQQSGEPLLWNPVRCDFYFGRCGSPNLA